MLAPSDLPQARKGKGRKAVVRSKERMPPRRAPVTNGATCFCANRPRQQDRGPKLAVLVAPPCQVMLPFPLGELWLLALPAEPAVLVAVAACVAAQDTPSAGLLNFVTPMCSCA